VRDQGAQPDLRGEFVFLKRLRAELAGAEREGELHIGDDAAVLVPPKGRLLLATDILVEDVHFDLSIGTPADAGWKAIAVNVSDIAAMGGRSSHAVVALSAPATVDLDEVFTGIKEAARSYGVTLVGGDLSGGEKLVIAVTVIGESGSTAPLTRRGAQAGDLLWCTGPLGGSAAGLAALRRGARADTLLARAYLRPLARPAEGISAARAGASAMIDVSDGLAADAVHIAEESGLGLEICSVPVAPGADEDLALSGGEDLELVFTANPEAPVEQTFAEAGLRPPLLIGQMVAGTEFHRLRGGVLPRLGWVHEVGSGRAQPRSKLGPPDAERAE
jgi:thiamine-monophosphate kinase